MNIIITGGYSGIGLELTRLLLKDGHKLGLIVRNEKSISDTDPIFQDKNIDFFYGDLSKEEDLLTLVNDIENRWDKIDVLFNNAGILTDKAYYSPQGNEMQFEVNSLAPYLLTNRLKSLLMKSDFSTVITTSTAGMQKKKELNIKELKKPKEFIKLLGSYKTSKFASVLLMNHFANSNPYIKVRMVGPGANKTQMTKGNGMPRWLKPFRGLFYSTPIEGAKKLYKGAFDNTFKNKSGIYISNNKIKPIQLKINDLEVEKMLGKRKLHSII